MIRIKSLQRLVHALSRSKGWWDGIEDPKTTIPEKLALIHSEVSEALEDYRSSVDGSDLNVIIREENGKPIGFASELADVVIRVCDLAEALGIDLEQAIAVKHFYNATRSQRHGGKRC